jgi:hypothetical protein
MKTGSKLRSAVCDTEVIVVRAKRDGVLSCGGAAMVAERSGDRGAIDPAFAGGTLMGKRYGSADGAIEILCVKSGQGSLALDGTSLQIKDAKPLPSSD